MGGVRLTNSTDSGGESRAEFAERDCAAEDQTTGLAPDFFTLAREAAGTLAEADGEVRSSMLSSHISSLSLGLTRDGDPDVGSTDTTMCGVSTMGWSSCSCSSSSSSSSSSSFGVCAVRGSGLSPGGERRAALRRPPACAGRCELFRRLLLLDVLAPLSGAASSHSSSDTPLESSRPLASWRCLRRDSEEAEATNLRFLSFVESAGREGEGDEDAASRTTIADRVVTSTVLVV
jgi:hypothetical protein